MAEHTIGLKMVNLEHDGCVLTRMSSIVATSARLFASTCYSTYYPSGVQAPSTY